MRRQPGCRQWWAVGILLASVASAAPAFAQDKSAPSAAPKAAQTVNGPRAPAAEDPEKESARLFDDGVKAAKAGLWEKARVSMLAAFKLKPSYARAANLGRVELMAGKPRDAAEHLSYFLREAQGIEAEDRKAAETMLAEAKAKLATVTILADPAGAQLLVDGEPVGTAPLSRPVFVEPGSRRFEAKKEGMASTSQDVQVAAGSTPVVELKLAKEAALAVGPSMQPHSDVPIEPTSPKWRSWTIASGTGLAAIGIGIGVGFSAVASAKNADVVAERDILSNYADKNHPICPNQAGDTHCATLADLAKTRDTARNVAITGFVVGGVAAASALVALLWKSKHPVKSSQSTFVVVPSPQGTLIATGTF